MKSNFSVVEYKRSNYLHELIKTLKITFHCDNAIFIITLLQKNKTNNAEEKLQYIIQGTKSIFPTE